MMTKLEMALRCISDGLPIPTDLIADLLDQGIDISALNPTSEELEDFAFQDISKDTSHG